ncbi:MAG TPA: glycosyltransferase family 2 protein [Anaerolineales bacterium]
MGPQAILAVDIVIPVYNEAGVVERSYETLSAAIASSAHNFTVSYVNDGSTDSTAASLAGLAARDPRVRVIELSRNFGHQAALTAGIDAALGDAVVTMDCDGQHPPELIPQMLDLISNGYDIVQGQRAPDAEGTGFKKSTSTAFYRLLNAISGTHVEPGAADFRALSRQAVDALKSMPEYHRFLRGMISWMGFRSVILPYHESTRIAGRSKYSLAKMLRLAMDALFSFSLAPLYIGLSLGGLFLCMALLEMLYVLSFWVTGRTSGLAAGWSSLMFVLLIIGGMLMILLGFVGVYVGYIFQEVKRRPVYLVRKGGPNA